MTKKQITLRLKKHRDISTEQEITQTQCKFALEELEVELMLLKKAVPIAVEAAEYYEMDEDDFLRD